MEPGTVLPFQRNDLKKRRGFEVGGQKPSTTYGQLPRWLSQRKEISATAKVVYAALADYKGSSSSAYPSREELADRCGMNLSAVRDALRQLRVHGLIEVHRRGLGKTNLYTLLPPPSGWVEFEHLTRYGQEDRFPGHPMAGARRLCRDS